MCVIGAHPSTLDGYQLDLHRGIDLAQVLLSWHLLQKHGITIGERSMAAFRGAVYSLEMDIGHDAMVVGCGYVVIIVTMATVGCADNSVICHSNVLYYLS